MTLLAAPALAALVLAIPLLALHLRRRRPPRRAVGSLLAWRDLPGAGGGGARRFGRPPLPLLLLLQLLALVLLVVALAHPAKEKSAAGSSHVYVVDQSMWMGAEDGGGTRIEAAAAELRERLAGLAPGDAVRIVGAGPTPTILYEGAAGGAGAAVGRLSAGASPANLTAALRLAAGLRAGDGDQIVLLRAPEEAAPRVRGGGSSYEAVTVGEPVDDVSIGGASAHCDLLGAEACEVFVRLTDHGAAAASVPVRIEVEGGETRSKAVEVPAGGSAPLVFTATPGAKLKISVPAGGDGPAVADSAFVSVPEPGGERITLVGERTRALPLARALASVPGVKLRLRTPQSYKASDPSTSDLLVLDDFVPKGGLPDAPALLLVHPPSFPGGSVRGAMHDSRMSGTEAASPLLDGVDLESLTIGAGASQRLSLPALFSAAAWSAEGPLIAAGVDGGRRVATISFEPSESNLPQLGGFPTLIDNIVAWSQRLAPQSAAAGVPFGLVEPPGTTAASIAPSAGGEARSLGVAAGSEVPVRVATPGNYVVTVEGSWGTRELALAVNPGSTPPAGAPVDLAAPAPTAHAGHTDLWKWLLVAALVVLILEGAYSLWREPLRGGPRRRRLVVGLQVASLVLVAVALFDPTSGSSAPPTTLVLDRSLSVGPRSAEAESAWLATDEGCGSGCHVVQFGGGAELTGAGTGVLASEPTGSLEGRQTNLQGAVEVALARTPRGGRVVLLSDGRQTVGEPLALAAAARERGVTLDTVALSAQPADAAVTRLEAPGALHAGDPLSLEVTVRSTVVEPAKIVVRRDGVVIGHQAVELGEGDNPFLFGVRAPRHPGSYGYEVTVTSERDARPQNDTLGTSVRVSTAPHVLVAGADGSAAAELMKADGFKVTTVAPGALPSTAAGYAGVDGVVLEDVSNEELGKKPAEAIGEAVRDRALGLLALGGEHSFSLGKYYKSPLQEVLPVKSLVPGKLQRKNVAIELVLDRSGSMINEAGGVPKIAQAQAAARGAVEFLLKHRDEVGIVTFEIKPKTLVPLTRVESGNVDEIVKKINSIPANGGTNIYKGLAAGVKEIEKSKAKDRHIILLTDGISEPGTYAELVPGLKKGKISVATVALGAEADFALLKRIAADTGGNYYATENARDLPKIFSKETRINTRTVRLVGRLGVSAGDPSPITGSLVGRPLPPLGGNVVTVLKPGAEAALLAQDKNHPPDPALAQWQYGSGRVAAWTPGLTPEWAGEWLDRPQLFQDAARWIERGVMPPPLTPSLVAGDRRELEVAPVNAAGRPIELESLHGTLTSPQGKTTTLRFEEAASGRWTAPLPELAAGEYEYALSSVGAGSLTGRLAIPYAAEYRLGRVDTTPLGPLAAASGGTTLAVADPGHIEGDSHHLWWVFAALGLAAFLAGVALRLLGGGAGEEDSEPPKRQDLPDRDADPAPIGEAQPA
ncbi:MAG TPA: VWA domain-containing protein [Solirubrobacterales bacterium]|nr:VWA domain-containing protein [Solirubrobacterales bacterium]